jgi:hypothetical protein
MYEIIEHHGIKGMKWGVRRTDAQLGNVATRIRSGVKRTEAQLHQLKLRVNGVIKKANARMAKNAASHKKVSDMTDDELRQRIARLNMEKQYRDVDAYLNPQKKSVVKKLLGEAAENLGRKTLNAAVDKLVGKIFKTPDLTLDSLKDSDLTKLGADVLKKAAEASKNANMVDSTLSKFFHRPKAGEEESSGSESKSADSDKEESKPSEPDTAVAKSHDSERATAKSSEPDTAPTNEPEHTTTDDSGAFSTASNRGMTYVDRWMYGKSGSDARKEQRAYETYEALKEQRVNKAVEKASHKLLEDMARNAEDDMRRLGL